MGIYPVFLEIQRGLEACCFSRPQHRGDVCAMLMEILSDMLADTISPSTRPDDGYVQWNQNPSHFLCLNKNYLYFNTVNATGKIGSVWTILSLPSRWQSFSF
jgi:hypothetical protein